MVRLGEIQRTAAFAWSPGAGKPLLVTGTRAGAVDDDFSAESKLEVWDLDWDDAHSGQEPTPTATLGMDSRFYDIAWGPASDDHPLGVIAGALENGSLDLWDAKKLLSGDPDALMSRTTKHTGPVKAVQFNLQRAHVLATAGSKGELFIYDVNDPSSAFRLGTAAARSDDLECLAWNGLVSHILATGGPGGFVMVWDLKSKKASWTLNNRKPVSAIAWDPNNSTKLMVATPDDANPAILLWDLRNSNAPERTLRGHEQGVLSLSWCRKDADIMLSCGKDNKTMVWNPQTAERYGEFPEVTNWTFLTRFNPHNPTLLATASFDGKIVVQTLQNTNPDASQAAANNNLDGEDFFSSGQAQPQGPSFSLPKAPAWLARPVGASFGFGGKLVFFKPAAAGQKKASQLVISQYSVDSDVGSATYKFETSLGAGDISTICKDKVANAKTDEEKADWLVMETLVGENPRERIIEYLGLRKDEPAAEPADEAEPDAESEEKPAAADADKPEDDSDFFGNGGGGDGAAEDFLSSLAATRGVKTDNPFHLVGSSDTSVEKDITRAILLGDFARATGICLKENRMADAFLVANCGGPGLVDKVQAAYLSQKEGGPSYVRLLGSVITKNLWDVVYNADLSNWKEAMAVLCTFSSPSEFPGLCEALGDRLIEGSRKDASFCYLVGSKLDKVTSIWISELDEAEEAGLQEESRDSTFSVHARALQQFIEKVTVFRHVTKFRDDERALPAGWKLAALYDKYTEYADIVAAHGQLGVAQKYLDLLPNEYPAAEVARNRIRLATQREAPRPAAKKQAAAAAAAAVSAVAAAPRVSSRTSMPYPPAQPLQQQPPPASASAAAAAAAAANPYAPPGPAPTPYQASGIANPYQPSGSTPPGPYAPRTGYQPNQLPPPGPLGPPGFGMQNSFAPPPPPRNKTPSAPPPSQSRAMDNWNDVPMVTKAPPRRNTPNVIGPITSPFPGPPGVSSPPIQGGYAGGVGGGVPHPPPRGVAPPPRNDSPRLDSPGMFQQHAHGTPSTAANAYAPPPTPPQPGSGSAPPLVNLKILGVSSYDDFLASDASSSEAPPSNRYAPAPASQPPGQPPPGAGAGAGPGPRPGPNRYAPSPAATQNHYAAPPYGGPPAPGPTPPQYGGGPPPSGAGPTPGHYGPPHQGPTPGPMPGPPPRGSTPQAFPPPPPPSDAAARAKPGHPAGDRSHMTPEGRRIFDILDGEIRSLAAKAPPTFAPHVKDTEKRLNFLFDHLNNQELLQPGTVAELGQLAEALGAKDFDTAQRLRVAMQKEKADECGNWMVGLKRLITMSKNSA